MAAHQGADELLRGLHDEYVWEVNAAIGEGRADLVQQLVDDHLDRAMRVMTELYGDPCDGAGCAACTKPVPQPQRARWWQRLLGP